MPKPTKQSKSSLQNITKWLKSYGLVVLLTFILVVMALAFYEVYMENHAPIYKADPALENK